MNMRLETVETIHAGSENSHVRLIVHMQETLHLLGAHLGLEDTTNLELAPPSPKFTI